MAKGWITPEDVSAQVTLRNLYGTPAIEPPHHRENRPLSRRVLLRRIPRITPFSTGCAITSRRSNPSPTISARRPATTTAPYPSTSNLERFADATYQMNFETEGFEAEGGRSVATTVSALVSPLPYVVGYKSDGALDYVKMNRGQTVEFIAIDQGLNRIAVQNLKLTRHAAGLCLRPHKAGRWHLRL